MTVLRFFIITFIITLLLPTLTLAEPTIEELELEIKRLTTQMDLIQDQMQRQIYSLQDKLNELKQQHRSEQLKASESLSLTESFGEKISTSAKYDIKLYGKIKADYIYDTKDAGTDEIITFIPAQADERSRSTYTVRETRIGLDIVGPSLRDWQSKGVIETDFYGSEPSSGSGTLRIRRAFINLSKDKTSVLAGQDWVPVGAMNPDTLNFGIMGYSGNLWDRAPQLTLQYKVNSTITGLLTTYRHRFDDDRENGLDTKFRLPWFGAKVAYEKTLFDSYRKAYFALGGALRSGEVEKNHVTPNLTIFEFKVPYGIFELKGEAYKGRGLGTEYFHKGGAFNLKAQEISTEGGFVQLGIRAADSVNVYAGYGVDNPQNGDIAEDEFYEENHYVFGTLYYTFVHDIKLGLEVTHLKTYWDVEDEEGMRFQSSLIFLW
jgi:hypothetical protein